jgi:hypothetical protein
MKAIVDYKLQGFAGFHYGSRGCQGRTGVWRCTEAARPRQIVLLWVGACGVRAACRSAVEGRHLRQKPHGNAAVFRKPEGLKPFGWTAAGRKPGAGCWGQPRPGEERTGWASPPSPCGRPCRAGRPTKEDGARLTAFGLSVQPERSGG